jgi:hypothetical protein
MVCLATHFACWCSRGCSGSSFAWRTVNHFIVFLVFVIIVVHYQLFRIPQPNIGSPADATQNVAVAENFNDSWNIHDHDLPRLPVLCWGNGHDANYCACVGSLEHVQATQHIASEDIDIAANMQPRLSRPSGRMKVPRAFPNLLIPSAETQNQ